MVKQDVWKSQQRSFWDGGSTCQGSRQTVFLRKTKISWLILSAFVVDQSGAPGWASELGRQAHMLRSQGEAGKWPALSGQLDYNIGYHIYLE